MHVSKSFLTDLVYKVNGAAIEVHKTLGPGLLESVYHRCMRRELLDRKIEFESNLMVPIQYKSDSMEAELRCDFMVEKILVVELKAVENVLPVHQAQILTYMKLLNSPIGLMINFNVVNIFKDGQRTFVNELYRSLPN